MNSIQKEQILRVNCPGFGEENYFSVGKAKSLDAYKVIIVNPVSIFHLFDSDLKLQKEIDNDLADGLTSRTVASDTILQSIQEELKTRRILELVSFLEKGGLLIYYLCRPFLVQGDNIAIDNYAWLESLAPDSSPDDNIRHMSAVSHGRVVEATPEGELSEFGPYLTQQGLEWNTIIRQDFLTDGYKPLATAGPRKCIAAQLMAGDAGGRIVFLPAPYSPDFDKKLVECIQDWNAKTHEGGVVEIAASAPVAAAPAPAATVAEPAPVVEAAPAPVVATPVIETPVAETPAIVTPAPVAEVTPVVETPAPVAVAPAVIVTPPPPPVVEVAPVAETPAPIPVAVEEPATIITPAPVVEAAAVPEAPAPEVVVTPPPSVVVPEPVVATAAEPVVDLVREMELLAQANPAVTTASAAASSFTPQATTSEPVVLGAKIARGLFGDDDDDDRLDIGSPAFAMPATPAVQPAAETPVVVTPAPIPHVTPAPLIQTLVAASEHAAQVAAAAAPVEAAPTPVVTPAPASEPVVASSLVESASVESAPIVAETPVVVESPVVIEAPVVPPAAEALIPAIDETQQLKAAQLSIPDSLDLDAIETASASLSTSAELQVPPAPVVESPTIAETVAEVTPEPIPTPVVEVETAPAPMPAPVPEIPTPAVSPLASLPIEVMPMPEAVTTGNGKANGNGNHHDEAPHENIKAEEVNLAEISSANSELAAYAVDAKQPEAKDLIKKMEEISKNTNSDIAFDIVLPQSEDLRKKRVGLLDAIKQAQAEIANVENKLSQIEQLKNSLLRGEGDDLVAACQRILTKLGWDAQPSEKSEQELYLLASDKPQAMARIVRSTAQAKRTDVAELGESVCSFWGEHEIEAKGLMLACTWAERGLAERQEQDYTDGLAQFAQKKSLCLMTTLQLLCMYRDVELGRLTAEDARNKILETNGRLPGFQVEAPLVTA